MCLLIASVSFHWRLRWIRWTRYTLRAVWQLAVTIQLTSLRPAKLIRLITLQQQETDHEMR